MDDCTAVITCDMIAALMDLFSLFRSIAWSLITGSSKHSTLFEMFNSISAKATVPSTWVGESLPNRTAPRPSYQVASDDSRCNPQQQKRKNYRKSFLRLFMLRKPNSSQLTATDAITENLAIVFDICIYLSLLLAAVVPCAKITTVRTCLQIWILGLLDVFSGFVQNIIENPSSMES